MFPMSFNVIFYVWNVCNIDMKLLCIIYAAVRAATVPSLRTFRKMIGAQWELKQWHGPGPKHRNLQ